MADNAPQNVKDPLVRVLGMDANGRAFFQNVHAQQLSKTGAVLVSLDCQLNVGDVIAVQLADKKARFKVTRVSAALLPQRINAEVQILENQECPWKELASAGAVTGGSTPQLSGRDKRSFLRHKIRFPIEIQDGRNLSARMQTNATDISGRGCYVEVLVPLPLGTMVYVMLWMDSEKISTSGLVRASDPGVGMGIEFTGLEVDIQDRLQKYLDKLDDSRLGPR